jgi:hypothetical protein
MGAHRKTVVRLTAADKRNIVKCAHRAGLNVSDFLQRTGESHALGDTREVGTLPPRAARLTEASMDLAEGPKSWAASSNPAIDSSAKASTRV